MDNKTINDIALKYGWSVIDFCWLNSGLINSTVKIQAKEGTFILQKINNNVFKNPKWIDENIQLLSKHLHQIHSNYLFTKPVSTIDNETLVCLNNNYYRAFHFIQDTYTLDTVSSETQAYQAANAFANFTYNFSGFNSNQLQDTIPNFHNLNLRFIQFKEALKQGNQKRIEENTSFIEELLHQSTICKKFSVFTKSAEAFKRVTHHDTKINNVLFNNHKAVCVIDLDTVMAGYFISDVGDMIRTYVCPATEDETDFSKIVVREEVIQAIYDGYMHAMHTKLSNFEKQHFYFAGEAIIYMQALRFFTDYILNDIYYKTNSTHHNLIRAKNQFILVKALQQTLNNFRFH